MLCAAIIWHFAVVVCGVAALYFSLLLSLCVDVLLVCAEGYTQVTGVMAMMVTGRVLLVCALCVLCCGAGGVVYAMADRCSEGNGNLLTHMNNAESDAVFPTAECSLLSTQMGLIRAVEAGDEEGAELGGTVTSEKPKQLLSGTTSKGNDEVLTPVPPAPLPTAKLSDHVEKEKPLKTVDSNGIGDTRDPSGGKATESQRQSVGQSSSGSTVTQPGKDHNLNNPSESDASSNFAPTDDSDANIPPNVPERGVGALGKVNEDEDKTKKSKQAVQEDAGEHKKKTKMIIHQQGHLKMQRNWKKYHKQHHHH
ncbi:mucin-associated surface protein (MASP) [Trypanosoma cruzi]|nr:mucin-associated surface protein (MASP) [Trypanosoma cruzi]